MRKKSGNFEDLNFKELNILNKVQQGELQNLFKKTEQRNGGISFYDLVNILKSITLLKIRFWILIKLKQKIKSK